MTRQAFAQMLQKDLRQLGHSKDQCSVATFVQLLVQFHSHSSISFGAGSNEMRFDSCTRGQERTTELLW